MVHDIAVIIRRVGGIGRDHNRPRRHDGEVGDGPFRAVFSGDHDAVTRPDPGLIER